MEGSRFPNGVLIDRTALRRTETSKASQILRMRTDVTSRGVLSGGAITVNGLNTDRVDIAAFSGYTPRGDYIEESSANANVPLANYTATTVNVICAVYTENNVRSQPHETDGFTYPTEAQGSYRIRVFTLADFNNPTVLSATDDNLQNDAKDRCLVLGTVVAEGVGATLTTITSPTDYGNVLYTNPVQLSTISGVTILEVDPNTPTGTATLTFDDTGAPPYSFQYTSPGGIISAASTTSTDAILTITDGSGYWVKIQIIITQLPTGLVVPFAENFEVVNLYYQSIPRLTADDHLHRSYLGTGIVTPTNPHGYSLNDLSGQSLTFLDEHQDVMHCNGIWKGSSSNIFLGSISTVTTGGDTLSIVSPGSSDLYYINGEKLTGLNTNQVIFDAANFASGYLGATAKEGAKYYEMYVDDSEDLIPHLRAAYPDPRNCTGTWVVDMSPDHPAGSFDLEMTIAGPIILLKWGDTNGSGIIVRQASATGVTGQVVRLYHPNNIDWIDLYVGDDSLVGDAYVPTGAGTYVDTIVVQASLDRSQNLQFMGVTYWYNALVPRGSIGYPPIGATRALTDTRSWGTLCVDNISDTALRHMSYDPTFEYQKSGFLARRHLVDLSDWATSFLSGLNIRQFGGICYVNGKRLEVDGVDRTLTDNQTTIIWVDYEGALHFDDYNAAPFNGTDARVLEWLVGYPQEGDVAKYTEFVYSPEYVPQRGLPLYVITTLAGSVTNDYSLARYVGSHVEDWTVGTVSNILGSGSIPTGQFVGLEAALAYAALEKVTENNTNYNVTLKIVGRVVVSSTFTQPSYVTVEGSWDSDTYVYVAAPFDSAGSWRLSEGCVVRNVRVEGWLGPVFGLADNVVLDHIKFEPGDTATYFSTLTQSAEDVLIQNCDITCNRGMFYLLILGPNFDRMRLLNNKVTTTNSQGNPGIRLDSAPFAIVSGNYIDKDNSNSNVDPAFYATNSAGIRVTGNAIRIGQGDGSDYEKGIYLSVCNASYITENSVTPRTGSTSTAGIGIQANDSAAVVIDGNVVNYMGRAILVGPDPSESGFFENVTVSNNVIGSCYSAGISVQADTAGLTANTLVGLDISNNQIYSLAKSAAVDPLFGAELYGIEVFVNNSALLSMKSINIIDNIVDTVVNAQSSGGASGVYVYLLGDNTTSAVIDNVNISRNSISRLSTTSGNATNGIYVNYRLGGTSCRVLNCSHTDNNIYLLSTFNAASLTAVRGIYASAQTTNGRFTDGKFDNNSIYISASPDTSVGDGIFFANTTLDLFEKTSINGNTLNVPWYGIEAGLEGGSTIIGNNILAGSVGIFMDNSSAFKISNNAIGVYSSNANRDFRIDGVNYGVFGVLLKDADSNWLLTDNTITMADLSILQESACICIDCDTNPEVINIDGNVTYQNYISVSGGGVLYHVYLRNPDGSWSFSRNTIYNFGKGVLLGATDSHGLYVDFTVATSSDHRGVLSGNVFYGSHDDFLGGAVYETYVDTFTLGSVLLMSNYWSLWYDNGAFPYVTSQPYFSFSAFYSNGANMYDNWIAGPSYTTVAF